MVPASEVELSRISGDYERMKAAVNLPAHPLDRHLLLGTLVRHCYPRRHNGLRADLYGYAALHIEELPRLISAISRNEEGRLPYIQAFHALALAMCEEGRYEEAQSIWRRAAQIGYVDEVGLRYELELIEKRKRRAAKPGLGT